MEFERLVFERITFIQKKEVYRPVGIQFPVTKKNGDY
jgi:hypothetical protein